MYVFMLISRAWQNGRRERTRGGTVLLVPKKSPKITIFSHIL